MTRATISLSVLLTAAAAWGQTTGKAAWETLIQTPFPVGGKPTYSIFKVNVAPAPEVPPAPGPGHTHEGPVGVYIVSGSMDSQIDPDPPATFASGEFFNEAPGRVHRFFRNHSKTEPAVVLTFQAGYTGQATPSLKQSLAKAEGQTISLQRLTLPQGLSVEIPANSNPDAIVVLSGEVEIEQLGTHKAGDLFANQAGRSLAVKTIGGGPARLLLYRVSEKPPIEGQGK